MGLYADQSLEKVEFEDGSQVWLKKEMDCGDYEDLEPHMKGLSEETPSLSAVHKMLEVNIKKILTADGKEIAVTSEEIRSFGIEARTQLLNKVMELNAPFLARATGKPTE